CPGHPLLRTPFPYTTLFRSVQLLRHELAAVSGVLDGPGQRLLLKPLLVGMEKLVAAKVVLEAQFIGLLQQRVQQFQVIDREAHGDRKSTRLNSSHVKISYAV